MELNEFLVKAKISTYASEGERGEAILDDSSKELIYEKGNFKYRDRYFGFKAFVGEEIVWKEGKAIWGMNYYGEITSNPVSDKEIYTFLQKCLRQIKKERPFRGPTSFKEGDFEYIDESQGEIDKFTGVEKILYKGEVVFFLNYHGGIIKKK